MGISCPQGATRPGSVRRLRLATLRELFLGRKLNPDDAGIFHHLSLIAFFAWVGLGADGLSSSCYGPAETFLALGHHTHLAFFVAVASALTVFVISASYSQIIELFPTGGGGYVVASKLLSPAVGMVSGCALLIDYVLTITLSIASGADAVFSFLPGEWFGYRLVFAVAGVLVLTIINLRGVKESVMALVPIFMLFLVTHALGLGWGIAGHLAHAPEIAAGIGADISAAHSELGFMGLALLMLRAYSMGAGTYTGIEAVSNGLPILREPKVATGRRTMTYMAVSLSVTVFTLIIAYLLFGVAEEHGKTLNAVLFESITRDWGGYGRAFVLVTLASEAALLFVAAQAGFLDGPRVLANMAQDRWFPTKFAMLSDRLVTQNGILLMGGAGLILMLATRGSVDLLIVLYSINVFITFVLSQLGMVRHWWTVRRSGAASGWRHKLAINGLGLALTGFILVSVTVVKFFEGGWVTILVTGALVALALLVRAHYDRIGAMLRQLDGLVDAAEAECAHEAHPDALAPFDPNAKTAVLLVNGYNGLGLHTLLGVLRTFGGDYRNFVFMQIGMVDAGVFKGAGEIDRLKAHINGQLDRYVSFMTRQGYHAQGVSAIGIDVVEEICALAESVRDRYPRAVFFGGQIVFPQESVWTRMLHNYVVFAVQRRLYRRGAPFVIMPVRV